MTAFTLEKHGHLALLTLNSPQNRNLLTPDIADELAVAVSELAADMTVKALAITGSERAFCAGADLGVLLQASDGEGDALQRIYAAFTCVAQSPLLTIALINGPAVGAGMNLAMACDLRIATTDAWFESRFFGLGIHPGGGHTWLLPQLLGWQQAAAMIFSGERLSASAALHAGFVKELVPTDELLTRAKTLVGSLAAVPAELVRETKTSMLALRGCPTQDEAVSYEFSRQLASLKTTTAKQNIADLYAKIQRK